MKKRTAFILLTLALLLCLSPALTAADGNGNELPIISNDPS